MKIVYILTSFFRRIKFCPCMRSFSCCFKKSVLLRLLFKFSIDFLALSPWFLSICLKLFLDSNKYHFSFVFVLSGRWGRLQGWGSWRFCLLMGVVFLSLLGDFLAILDKFNMMLASLECYIKKKTRLSAVNVWQSIEHHGILHFHPAKEF